MAPFQPMLTITDPSPDPLTGCSPADLAWEDLLADPPSAKRTQRARTLIGKVSRSATVERWLGQAVQAGDPELLRLALAAPLLPRMLSDDAPLVLAIEHGRVDLTRLLLARAPLKQTPHPLMAALTPTSKLELVDELLTDPRMKAEAQKGEALIKLLAHEAPDLDERVIARLAAVTAIKAFQEAMEQRIHSVLAQDVRARLNPRQASWALDDLEKSREQDAVCASMATAEEQTRAWSPAWRMLDRLSIHVNPVLVREWIERHGEEHFPRWQARQRGMEAHTVAPESRSRRRPRA
jgi:hypothetical protein